MSKYQVQPYDLSRIKTYPLKSRPSKVAVDLFGRPHEKGGTVSEFLQSLPAILASRNLKDLACAIVNARSNGKPAIWGMGGHVIKTGLSPILIDLMDRGLITALALNGSCLIHDFEIALIGSTSEDVEVQLQTGAFGMAEETGRGINQAIRDGVADGLGIGESLGRHLSNLNPPFGRYSLLLQAYLRNIPVTVHVTIGADIIHNHPMISPAAIGEGSHRDFRLLAGMIAELNGGGVYLNCGSAVTLPEVFLKCVTLVRNSGQQLQRFHDCQSGFHPALPAHRKCHQKTRQKWRPRNSDHRSPRDLIPLLAAWLVELSPDTRDDAWDLPVN